MENSVMFLYEKRGEDMYSVFWMIDGGERFVACVQYEEQAEELTAVLGEIFMAGQLLGINQMGEAVDKRTKQ